MLFQVERQRLVGQQVGRALEAVGPALGVGPQAKPAAPARLLARQEQRQAAIPRQIKYQ